MTIGKLDLSRGPGGRRLRRLEWAVTTGLLVVPALGACKQATKADHQKTAAAGGAKPNVLLISLCSVRADHLGCYGYPRETSPRIDGLAREGVLFERAVTPWPKTVPSFVSLHTGLYPHTTRVMRITPWQRLDDSFVTLAEVFQAAGYETLAYVSSPALNKTVNLTQGFDTYVETYRRPAPFEQTGGGAAGRLQIRGDGPFFWWVHFNNAHVPYRPPTDLRGRFVDDKYYDRSRRVRVSAEQNDLPVDPNHPYALQIRRGDLGGVYPPFVLDQWPTDRPTELDYYVAEYDAAIRAADRLIGELLDSLGELQLVEETLVVLVGDHGESLGEHDYFFEHGRLPYEPAQRVPLIMRGPRGLPAGRRVACPVGLIDLAPTILESAGLEVPPSMEGRSLLPVVRDEESCREVFFCAGYHLDFMTGIRQDRWKLVRVPNELDRAIMTGKEYELYDLSADPGELRNVYESRPEVAAQLRARLEEWVAPWWSQAVRTVVKQGPGGPDEETRSRLHSLGYVKQAERED